jgi:ankyrin repeat protein
VLHWEEKLDKAVIDNDVISVSRLIKVLSLRRMLNLPDNCRAGKSIRNSLLHLAAYSNSVEVTNYLIDNGEDANCKNSIGETPLHLAAQHNSWETADLLIRRGAEINAMNNAGKTPLDIAVSNGNDKLVDLLILVGKRG